MAQISLKFRETSVESLRLVNPDTGNSPADHVHQREIFLKQWKPATLSILPNDMSQESHDVSVYFHLFVTSLTEDLIDLQAHLTLLG